MPILMLNMINFFKLIRWKNLLLIALAQVLIKYALFESLDITLALDQLQFTLLVIATISIAAAGNIINDVYDIETDSINKPQKVIVGKYISEKRAITLFILCNIIGVGIGFYLSNSIQKSGFSVCFVIISALLYLYATHLKRTLLIGNIIVSLLVASSIIIIGIFDLVPVIDTKNQPEQLEAFKTVMVYATFAFIINLLREIVKDIEDINGDYNAGMKTFPIIIGRDRATKLVFTLSLIPLFLTTYYVIQYIYSSQLIVIYFLVFIVGPMLYFTIKCFTAETKKEIQHLSLVLKWIMLFGVLSLLQYPILL